MTDNNFLVYMYMRKDGTPYYVGKGRPNRPYKKRGRPCGTPPKERIVIYQENLDEETAFSLEKELIAKYGRKDVGTGILHNRTEGGEGSSGHRPSKETIFKRSGKNHWNYSPRDWYHPIHGEVLQKSPSELVEMFPEQKLHNSELCRMAKGGKIYAKGWCLLENRGSEVTSKVHKPRDWYHPDYGKVLQKTCAELSDMFPEQNLSKSCLSCVANERINHHKGWTLLENRDCKIKHFMRIPRDWFHPVHGEILGKSIPELLEMFPEQNLSRRGLSEVANSKQNSSRGWRLLKNKDCSFRSPEGILRDWFHPDHGEILQKSCTDIVEMFPDQKLSMGHLSGVATGKRRSHKGWRLLKNKNCDFKPYKGVSWNWFHPNHGEILGKSVSELIEMFPNEKLSRSHLGEVTRGEKKSYRGWTLLSESVES